MIDSMLQGAVRAFTEMSRFGLLPAGPCWRPGQKLKLLFAGYNGTRNTGSDVRVEEMLRQFRHILGQENLELSVMSQNFQRSRGYFGEARQVHLPDLFPAFLAREVPRHHGVVACEGSAFKSQFANALTTMMVGSLGIAAGLGRLSVAYGSEAGRMDPPVAALCSRFCKKSLVITRNQESREILSRLGVSSQLGTDTAWTFEPHPRPYAEKVLREQGWDGKSSILTICPVNPFWWPVKASLRKFLLRSHKDSQYRTVYFHNAGPEVDRLYERYLAAIARVVQAVRQERKLFVVLVATERLDTRACQSLSERLGGLPVLTSNDFDMYQLVSLLRRSDYLVSSRYHGIVTTMPALVPSLGITMDERIRNLMLDRGHPDLLMNVDDEDLEARLRASLETLFQNGDAIRVSLGRAVAANLKLMAEMGRLLEVEVGRLYPAFPFRAVPSSWLGYLPPLSEGLLQLLELHQ